MVNIPILLGLARSNGKPIKTKSGAGLSSSTSFIDGKLSKDIKQKISKEIMTLVSVADFNQKNIKKFYLPIITQMMRLKII